MKSIIIIIYLAFRAVYGHEDTTDILATPCTEDNVSRKYSRCFHAESDILVDNSFKSEPECLKEYMKVANCIAILGDKCGNGELATYMRFLYHEYNIQVAGEYACKNLEELRDVVGCVSSYGYAIDSCRYMHWYSSKMKTYLDQGTVEEKYCWNMGVAVQCRAQFARRCDHHLVYFNYLYSVYPTECQDFPWAAEKPKPGQIATKDCTTSNYMDVYIKCFNPEYIFSDGRTETCKTGFANYRTCLKHMYESCEKADLPAALKNVTHVDLSSVEKYACNNIKEIKKAADCIRTHKNGITSCILSQRRSIQTSVSYLLLTDPAKAACRLRAVETQCRMYYLNTCSNDAAYRKYINMLYPSCSRTAETTAAPPSTSCDDETFIDKYSTCFKKQKEIMKATKDKYTCNLNYQKVINCIRNLITDCPEISLKNQLINQVQSDDDTVNFICSQYAVIRSTTMCLDTVQKDADDCVDKMKKDLGVSQFKHLCQFTTIHERCEYKAMEKKCNNIQRYFEYQKRLLPIECSYPPITGAVVSSCEPELILPEFGKCFIKQATVFSTRSLFQGSCEGTDTLTCFRKAAESCSAKVHKDMDAIFTDQKRINRALMKACVEQSEMVMASNCVIVSSSWKSIEDCALAKAKLDEYSGLRKSDFCTLINNVKECLKPPPGCDNYDVFKKFVNDTIPAICSAHTAYTAPIILLAALLHICYKLTDSFIN